MPKWVDFRGCNSMTAMNRRVVAFDFGLLLVVAFSVIPRANAQATYTLKATPKTVTWGYYDAKAAPVLRVKSGDTVDVETLLTNSPKGLERAGVPADQVDRKSTRL